MSTLKPLADRIIVQRFDAETKSRGGLIIPDSVQEKPQRGKVVAIGMQVKELKVGDVVLFKKYSGSEADAALIMKEEDVMAVVVG